MIFQHRLIESLVALGEKTALEQGAKKISYAGLFEMANSVTGYLLKQGLENETIGIMLPGRPELIAAMIGVMNARCVFVPLAYDLPAQRLQTIIKDLNLAHIIKDFPGPDDAGPVTYPAYQPDDALYVYFTSGSTGTPKGIVGKNASLLQFIDWETATFGITEGTRISQFISPYFDAFLRDVFAPLLAGGTICIPPVEEDFFTPEKLIAWIDASRINIVHCVPSLFRVIDNDRLTPAHFQSLQYIMLSGEKIIPSELQHWYNVFGTRIQLVNFYGLTETTMIRAFFKIRPENATQAKIPVGYPIAGTELLVSKKDFRPCEKLVTGELYIISSYTAKGYLNAPELTHQKFLKIDTGTADEKIAFRTGDMARMLPSGEIDLIGRQDRQIKLRGIRIEPDEIENTIIQSGLVKTALVIKNDEGLQQEALLAFIIKQNAMMDDQALQAGLQEYLNERVPAYMIPSEIVIIEKYPLLTNGKIDHKALLQLVNNGKVIEPVTETEAKLLAVWKEILGNKPISTEDSFLRAGGNSLSIMKLIGRIYKDFNVRVSLSDLFNNLTIKKQSELIGRSSKDFLMTIHPALKKPSYHLSSAQQRVYYFYELNPGSTAFNFPMAFEILTEPDRSKMENTLLLLIQRHEALRTSFTIENGGLMQIVHDTSPFTLEEIDGTLQDMNDNIVQFIRPFNLGKLPLMRAAIIKGRNNTKCLVIDVHHIVCDGMSQVYLRNDFVRLYHGEALQPLPVQYKDYAEWEHRFRLTEEYIQHREYWLKMFESGIPSLALPTNNGNNKKLFSDRGGNTFFSIERSMVDPVTDFLKDEAITTSSIIFSVYLLYLSQLTGQDDIVTGVSTTGRMQDELEGVAGMFVKTLPVRCRVDVNMPFKNFVVQVHQQLTQANSKQVYDLADIVRELNQNRTEPIKNLFEAMFAFQNFDTAQQPSFTDIFAPWDFENSTAKYPLTLYVSEARGSFLFRVEYLTHYFTAHDIALLISGIKSLIENITRHQHATVMDCMGGMNSRVLPEENIVFNF